MSDESPDFLPIKNAIPMNTPVPPTNTPIVPTSTPRPRARVEAVGGLNLRSSPSILENNIIRLLANDEVVFLLGKRETPLGETVWVQVETDRGQVGWISAHAIVSIP